MRVSEDQGSGGERIARQVLDGEGQPGGQDRGGTLDREGADLGRTEAKVLGQAAERRVGRKRRGDLLDERVERRLAAAVGWR